MCCYYITATFTYRFVYPRITSTWMRQHVSWWRISWLMTKACLMRRAMETVSNWTRRLWLLRASRAAANTQSTHISPPPPHGRDPACSAGSVAVRPSEEQDFLQVIKAPGSSPLCAGARLTRTAMFLIAPRTLQAQFYLKITAIVVTAATLYYFIPQPLEHRIFIIVCHTASFIPEACCSLCLPESLWRPGLNHTWERVQAKQKIEKHKLQRNQ